MGRFSFLFSVVSGSFTVTVNALLSNMVCLSLMELLDKRGATPNENSNAVLTAPASTYFATVNFSSYGTPTGYKS
jgi:hypothetical protein